MTQFHFISGLPRSGSTLLSAILRQNPRVHASMTSPVSGIFSAMQRATSNGNEAAMFLTEGQRERLLRHVFDEYYADGDVVFDTSRMWTSKLPVLTRLFPDCRMICCVRPIAWIADSIERLIRANPFELSGIFGFEPGGTVYSRVGAMTSPNGLIGYAWNALREGFYSDQTNRLMLVEYEHLAKYPRATVDAIYKWIGLEPFTHDFENLEQIPGAKEFDTKLGTPGLHAVRSAVAWQERKMILPPDLSGNFPAPFWRSV